MKRFTKFYPVFAIIAVIVCAFVMTEGLDMIAGVSGMTLAMAGIAGTPTNKTVTTVDAEGQGILAEDISQVVGKLSPDRYPLDTIMRHPQMRKEKAENQVHKFFQRSSKPFSDEIDNTASGDGSAASTPAKLYTYASGNGVQIFWIKVKQPKLWRKHDTMLMHNLTILDTHLVGVIAGETDVISESIAFYVEDVDLDYSAIKVRPVSGIKKQSTDTAFVMPDFAATQLLVRMGQAKSEMAFSTDPIAIIPESSEQYCQNFMAQIEQSTFEALTKKKIAYGIKDQERDTLEAFKGEIELSCLFGRKFVKVDGNDRTYFTGGIVWDIPNTLNYGDGEGGYEVSKAQYSEWLRKIFVGNNGSRERFLFAGSELLKSIEQLRESYKTMAASSKTVEHLGVICQDITSTFGTLHIVHMPSLNETGWAKNGIVLDLTNVYKVNFVPMQAVELDFKKTGQKNADGKLLQEVTALVLRYPECHAVITPA